MTDSKTAILRTKRSIPFEATEVQVDTHGIANSAATVYLWTQKDSKTGEDFYVAKMFQGRKTKHYSFLGYKTEELRDESYKMFIRHNQERADNTFKAQQKGRDVEVGDILYSSWGHEQTNIDFYQVVGLVGKKSVEVREIGQDRKYDAQMSGVCMPIKDSFNGSVPFTKQYGEYGIVISSFQSAKKWDGTPKSWSSYA